MYKTIYSSAIHVSFDTRVKLINFNENQNGVGVRTSNSHK